MARVLKNEDGLETVEEVESIRITRDHATFSYFARVEYFGGRLEGWEFSSVNGRELALVERIVSSGINLDDYVLDLTRWTLVHTSMPRQEQIIDANGNLVSVIREREGDREYERGLARERLVRNTSTNNATNESRVATNDNNDDDLPDTTMDRIINSLEIDDIDERELDRGIGGSANITSYNQVVRANRDDVVKLGKDLGSGRAKLDITETRANIRKYGEELGNVIDGIDI